MTNMEFRAIRKLLSLSQEQLAGLLKTTKQSIWRWETNGPYAQAVPPLEAEVMRWFARGYRPREWPEKPGQKSRPAPPRYQGVEA